MKKIALIVLGALLCTLTLEANKIPGYVPPETKKKVKKPEIYHAVWEKTYGGEDNDIAHGIVALENGESAMVGTCRSFNAQYTDICVTRLNAQGEMKWRLLLGGAKQDEGKAISRAADGTLMGEGGMEDKGGARYQPVGPLLLNTGEPSEGLAGHILPQAVTAEEGCVHIKEFRLAQGCPPVCLKAAQPEGDRSVCRDPAEVVVEPLDEEPVAIGGDHPP